MPPETRGPSPKDIGAEFSKLEKEFMPRGKGAKQEKAEQVDPQQVVEKTWENTGKAARELYGSLAASADDEIMKRPNSGKRQFWETFNEVRKTVDEKVKPMLDKLVSEGKIEEYLSLKGCFVNPEHVTWREKKGGAGQRPPERVAVGESPEVLAKAMEHFSERQRDTVTGMLERHATSTLVDALENEEKTGKPAAEYVKENAGPNTMNYLEGLPADERKAIEEQAKGRRSALKKSIEIDKNYNLQTHSDVERNKKAIADDTEAVATKAEKSGDKLTAFYLRNGRFTLAENEDSPDLVSFLKEKPALIPDGRAFLSPSQSARLDRELQRKK